MPRTARLALLAAVVLWAVSFVATKVALEEAPPLVVVSLRLAISAACFLPWLASTGGARGLGGARGMGRLSRRLCSSRRTSASSSMSTTSRH